VKGEPSKDTPSVSASPVQEPGGLPRKKDQGKEARSSGGVDPINKLIAMT
jgi:hypothetical protein